MSCGELAIEPRVCGREVQGLGGRLVALSASDSLEVPDRPRAHHAQVT